MIQTNFFPQPEKNKPVKIIQINPSDLQPRKVEELIPDILPNTFIIYPKGGYHPFYGVPNTFPRYQLPIWPCVKRIKFSDFYTNEEMLDKARRSNMSKNQTLEHLNLTFHRGYPGVGLAKTSREIVIKYTQLNKNGNPYTGRRNIPKHCVIHRLIALAWIPNPENKPQVMHINDDPTNYLLENLKWGTSSENSKGRKRNSDTMEHKYLNFVNKGFVKG